MPTLNGSVSYGVTNMRICNHCGGEVVEKTYTISDGMDGCSVCLDCGIIEGGDTWEDEL